MEKADYLNKAAVALHFFLHLLPLLISFSPQ